MLFASFEFILYFLPLVVAGYFLLQKYNLDNFKSFWLLVSSAVFYAFWNWENLIPFIISASINYCIYIIMIQATKNRKYYLSIGILFNLLFLSLYKYSFLFFKSKPAEIPLGISFYTFTQIAFLVDGFAQKFKKISISKYFLFVGYFPHLICGPILIFKDFYPQLLKKKQLRIDMDNVVYFLFFFSVGLFKKTFIADPLGLYVSYVFDLNAETTLNFHTALLASLCYSFQLYADFSGYSDMAVGLSRLFGITIPFNFNAPYHAASIIEFWRRWHMSLSNFLKNYVYIPLGGNRTNGIRYVFNLLIVMIIGGVWHGSSSTFLVWGLYHGILLVLNHQQRRLFPKLQLTVEIPRPILEGSKILCTFTFVSLGWIIFRSHDMNHTFRVFRSIFLFENQGVILDFTTKWQYIAVLCGAFIAFILPETNKIYEKFLMQQGENRQIERGAPFAGAVSGILMAVGILLLNKPHQFLYSGF